MRDRDYFSKEINLKSIEGNIKPIYWEDKAEPLHIIEELKPKEEIETFIIRYPDNQELMNKINEIIKVVNIMMRGK